MKKIVLLAFVGLLTSNLFAQVFKLEPVFQDKGSNTYLSHKKVLESKETLPSDSMILWGYHLYFNDWVNGAYEVVYFRGNAKETYSFLKQVIGFTEKYQKEDQVMTFIQGVKVKTMKQAIFKYTMVYDTQRKVICMYNLKQWNTIMSQFVAYCEKQQIAYE